MLHNTFILRSLKSLFIVDSNNMALNLNQKSRRMSVEISEHFVDNFIERWKLVTRDNLSPGDAVTVSSCPPSSCPQSSAGTAEGGAEIGVHYWASGLMAAIS